MSDITFKAPYTKVLNIEPHPNAHSLDIATVYDFKVVVRKGQYSIGDEIIFVPVDSILPSWLEEKLFGPDSKIKLNKSRVRQIRIRGFASQGMLINPLEIDYTDRLRGLDNIPEVDLAEVLGIEKYQPPTRLSTPASAIKRDKSLENKYFHKYTKFPNIKWYPEVFKPDEIVSITEKLHGSNFRAGWVPNYPKNIWERMLKFLKLLPSYEYVYGSHNVQLQEKPGHKTFYDENIYERISNQYDLKNKLLPGEVIYGEIIGPGIQKNYTYGIPEGELKLVLFDLKTQTTDSSVYVDVDHFQTWCSQRGFEKCPEIYRGLYNKDLVYAMASGMSVYSSYNDVLEGVVVKPLIEIPSSIIGRKVLKVISEQYLDDKSNTDVH